MESSLKDLFNLEGRVGIVTGGSRGLGLKIAQALGEFGAVPVLVARKQTELDEAVATLATMGIHAHAWVSDLGSQDAPARLVEQVMTRFGRIDILVNNAGTTWGAPAEDYPLDGWQKVLNLNVTGMFLLSQAVAKAAFIPQGKGTIINIASILGLVGTPPWQLGTVGYNTAKGAVLSMTRALAAEWGVKGIRINAIAPGFIPSKMTAGTIGEVGERMIEMTPLGKLGSASDLMGPVLLLASDAGGHITGQVIVVDGGTTII